MFTHVDLSRLLTDSPRLGVSMFLPTHDRGSEIRQGSLRLRHLVAQAFDGLTTAGLNRTDAGSFLAPVTALVDDYAFWQHQERGLALFLDGDRLRLHRTPFALPERVVVGPGFHLRPLLTGLVADGWFRILTITADDARLLRASRFSLDEEDGATLPGGVDDAPGEADYENPVQASPVARPHTGSIDISNAQVYGESPPEWRKGRLVRFVHRVAAAVDQHVTADPTPVVLAADAEISGHFRKSTSLGSLLAGVIEINAGSLDDRRLHEAAYDVVRSRLDTARGDALELFLTLRGNGDGRAVDGVPEVVRAAHQGRVATLLLPESEPVWGRFDEMSDQLIVGDTVGASGQDLLDVAATLTFRHGGQVHPLSTDTPLDAPVAAVLRY